MSRRDDEELSYLRLKMDKVRLQCELLRVQIDTAKDELRVFKINTDMEDDDDTYSVTVPRGG